MASARVRDLKSIACSEAAYGVPKRGGAQLVGGVSCGGFCTIPSPVPTSCSKKSLKGWSRSCSLEASGHAELCAVDDRSRGSGGDGFDVAGIAAELLEESLPGLSGCASSEGGIARRDFGAADELRKVVDVRPSRRSSGTSSRIRRDLAESWWCLWAAASW